MHIVLFDNDTRSRLYPLTLTRSVADMRLGIFTIRERWRHLTNQQIFIYTTPVLQGLYEDVPVDDCLFIDAAIMPTHQLVTELLRLRKDECLIDDKGFIAGRTANKFSSASDVKKNSFQTAINTSLQKRLEYPHQILQFNDEYIRFDYSLITNNRVSAKPHSSVHLMSDENIFIEEGAHISHSILNASAGPIYIGKDAVVMEGCMLRGPLAICEGATVKMGAKIYGATSIGSNNVVGGEVKNTVMFANSNKAHDGYLGDSVIGEWCNLGAGTSNSNVKNTAAEIKQWNYDEAFVLAGNKCGVIMGDYSRTAINTSINTGSVIGVSCNVFGAGLTPKFIPDFSWGMDGTTYNFDKAINDITNWKRLKNKTITVEEEKVLKHIFETSVTKT